MRIGILTQPLHINYGGTLQAYALQKILREMGHDAWIVRREPYREHNLNYWIRTNVGNIIRFLQCQPLRRWTWKGPKPSPSREIVEKNIQDFVEKWINPRTDFIYSTQELKKDQQEHEYQAYIVGSDQVWRPRYNDTTQTNFWLDFLGNDRSTLRIAYAASFGTDEWEYKGNLQKKCCKLAHQFDSISVREESGIRLLRDFFGVSNVKHVLDPTLLLKKEDYVNLVENRESDGNDKILMSYLLDFKQEKNNFISDLAFDMGLTVKSIRPRRKSAEYKYGDNDEDFVIPPISEWLKGFMDAKYVITDSFHGTVFSIIFNKPFITLVNSVRGISRLESLLGLFDIKSRLVSTFDIDTAKKILNYEIDWNRLNEVHEELKEQSIAFLRDSLK